MRNGNKDENHLEIAKNMIRADGLIDFNIFDVSTIKIPKFKS